ncbi:hypothetical protein CSC94_20645 [Zhengella mangrovi]|uniref:O-antigen ligase-related domain-containing protein n=1 Tax=Zhengella mangrovi TaxID=1982044 RepID=A0A2G1QI43_9HYPH|nr:O-antigen ligase family protein [Zhengella mangrovi]PHP65130.1 hypothetical protein CSC94_20645 [Zhengella mangrovi]
MAQVQTFATGSLADRDFGPVARKVLYWIPSVILAYSILVSPLFTKLFSGGPAADLNEAAAQSNPWNQLFWITLLFAAIAASWKKLLNLKWLVSDPVIVLIFCYLAFAAISVTWSPVPGIAFRRFALQVIVVLALSIPVILTSDRAALLGRVNAVMAVTVALNFVVVLTTPPGPIGHEGIYEQKNTLGAAMAFCWLFLLYAAAIGRGGRRWLFLFLAVAALFCLVKSESKTSLGLAILLPVLTWGAIVVTRPLAMNTALLVLAALVLALVGWFYVSALTGFDFADLSMILFNDTTFTGRTVIWQFVVDVISRSPVIGQGYASFWGIGAGSIVEREAPGFVAGLLQAHNGYLDTLIETGAIGLSILLAIIVAALFSAARFVRERPALSWLSMTLVLTVVSHNMLESSWFRGYSLIWMLFVFAAVLPRAGQGERLTKR